MDVLKRSGVVLAPSTTTPSMMMLLVVVMRALIASLLIVFSSMDAHAAGPYDTMDPAVKAALEAANRRLCDSTPEFVKTLKYLRSTKDFKFSEEHVRRIADQVSKGCNGAAERFQRILALFSKIGVSERRSLDMALEFAAYSPDVQKTFLEVFTKSFLSEFFDYEYEKAMRLAFELSRDYKGDPAIAREDFIALARYCKDSKSLDLSMLFCSSYAVQIAKLSQYHQNGVFKPFVDVFTDLREKRELSLDAKTALELSHGILKSGPKAPRNFFEAFELASNDLGLDKKKAIEFALNISARSYVGEIPPILQFTPETAKP